MGVYIDRDELLELYANTDELDISNYDVKVAIIRQNILDMPTIDLVRCGECKYQYMCGHQIKRNGLTLKLTCCEYGERRDDDSNT